MPGFYAALLYNFNGADANPDTNFTSVANNIQRLSNQGAATAANTAAYYNPATYGPDCSCGVVVATVPATPETVATAARMVQLGSAATMDGYSVQLTKAAGTDTIIVQRVDNGVGTTLGSSISQEVTGGDAMGIQCWGSAIEAWFKASGGVWAQIGARTDTTHTAAGNLMLATSSTATRFDDLLGGTVKKIKDLITSDGVFPKLR